MVPLLRDTEAHTQIHGPDEQHIRSIDSSDLFNVPDSFGGFDLQNRDQLRTGIPKVIVKSRSEGARAIHYRHTSVSSRRVAHCSDGPASFVRGLHIWNH